MEVRSTVEREIKLAVNDHFRLPHFPGTPLPRRQLTSTYYDTAGYDLAHAGITLRYRVARGTHAWQLKLPLINLRQELEIAGRQPDPPKTFRDLLLLHIGQRPLVPVATLRTWRTGVRVHQDNAPIADVTLDTVAVMKNGAVIQHLRELEIEQINGEDTTLREIERQLRRAGAETHDGRPKLFRALSLPAPGAEVQPGPDAPAAEHVRWALTHHVRWLFAHDPGTRFGREPESLHQMRVATRQLRAVLHAAK
ncbi:MAG TPA: CYTH domain-containing protein, partial [Nitrospira sp.]